MRKTHKLYCDEDSQGLCVNSSLASLRRQADGSHGFLKVTYYIIRHSAFLTLVITLRSLTSLSMSGSSAMFPFGMEALSTALGSSLGKLVDSVDSAGSSNAVQML